MSQESDKKAEKVGNQLLRLLKICLISDVVSLVVFLFWIMSIFWDWAIYGVAFGMILIIAINQIITTSTVRFLSDAVDSVLAALESSKATKDDFR